MEPIVWECECDRAAGEEDERECGAGGVESVGAADDQLHLVVQRLRPGVAQPEAAGREDALAVFSDRAAESHERFEAAAGEAGEEASDQLLDGRDAEVGLEDLTDCLLVRPGAGDLPAGGLQGGQGRGLAVGEVLGVLEQRPAGVLERVGGGELAEVAKLVPVLAAESSALVASATTW